MCVEAGTRATARGARVGIRGVPSGPRGGFPSRGSVAARCRARAENPPPTIKPSGRARGASLRGRIGNLRARRIRGAVTRGRTFIPDILQELLRRRVERGVLHHVQHLRRRGGERQRRSEVGMGARFRIRGGITSRNAVETGPRRSVFARRTRRRGRKRASERTLSPCGNPGREVWMRSCVLLLG